MTILQVLKKCQLFAALKETDLNQIASLTEAREYPAGAAIFREGTQAYELMVVDEGKVALQMVLSDGEAASPRGVTIDIITENEILGWSALVEPYMYTLAAVALQNTRLLRINGPGLRSLMEKNRDVGYEITKGLARVIAERLAATRHVLVSERLLTSKSS
jgi:CRP/FNR family transcriptional regulator, cyclic AMP receptor protein